MGESCQGDNPYRDLVEKYEALLKVQRHPGIIRPTQPAVTNNCMSLQEELQMSGDFSSFHKEDEDVDSEGEVREPPRKDPMKSTPVNGKAFSSTPTDFSEAETSSSGFSDETSNKGTQTDAHFPPGSFLCTISDGDDCRFSIYDDASPVESRFRKTPEYRQLFREIFAVLKRAAEAKDEGETLPLLDDYTPVSEHTPKVPPVTPAKEDPPSQLPDPEEQPQSLVSETSEDFAVSEVTKSLDNSIPASVQKSVQDDSKDNVQDTTNEPITTENVQTNESDKKKPTKDILEYLATVASKKKSGTKKHSGKIFVEPSSVLGINAKVLYSNKVTRRKKEVRMSESPCRQPERSSWNAGTSNDQSVRKDDSLNNEQHRHSSVWDPHPFTSAATQVATLKLLDKSYAEVLRQTGRPKNPNRVVNSHRK